MMKHDNVETLNQTQAVKIDCCERMLENIDSSSIRVLILSKKQDDVATAIRVLSEGELQFSHSHAASRAEFISALEQRVWDVMLADYSIGNFTPIDVLQYLQSIRLLLPVIAFAPESDEEQIVEAIRCGALDFVTTSKWSRLLPAVQRALQIGQYRGNYSNIEDSFRAFEDQFRQLLDVENASLLAWDARSEQFTFHYNFQSLFGVPRPPEENAIAYLIDRLHNEDRDQLERTQYSGLIKQDAFQFEGRVIWPDGSTQWLRANGKVFYDDSQSIQYIVVLAQNVTTQKQSYQLDAEAKNLDLETSKLRSMESLHRRFMMMAAHEFRTPLTIISTANELMYEHYDQMSAEAHRSYLQDIRDQIRALREMLTEIESIARDEYISKDFSPQPTNVVDLSREVIQEIFDYGRKVREIGFDNKLRSAIQVVDRRLLGHILSQLLQNAVKFSRPDGEVVLTLNDTTEGALIISVNDHGIGIPADDLPHIYDAFVRGSNIGAISGRGIGLKIVMDCVYAHQGSIDVRSTVGRGTQFTVTLPTRVE
jgi:signal transduction histidine kinase